MHVEHLIFNAHDLAEVQRDMATHHDVAMMRRSRLVERPCSLGAPIREHWLMVLVGKADATYVASVPRLVVKAPEHQTVLDGAQLGEPILVHGGEGVTFGALRGRAVGSGRAHVAQAFARLCAKVVEPAVGAVHYLLFFLNLRRVL